MAASPLEHQPFVVAQTWESSRLPQQCRVVWPGWHAEVLCRVPVRTPGEKNRCKAIIELCKETKGISSHWLQRDDDLFLYYKPLKLERPDGGLTLFDICSILAHLAEALDCMHNYTDQTGNGLMHGDIRPGTIGLKEGDRHWAFTDLLSLVFQNNSNTISDLSLQEDAKQSVAFWGPEMWLTRKPTPKSDIYALGVTMLRLLLPETFDIVTGIHLDVINRPDRLRDPRHYQALAEVVELHWQHVIDELQSRLPGSFPSEIFRLLSDMTSVEPERRPTAAHIARRCESMFARCCREKTWCTPSLWSLPVRQWDNIGPESKKDTSSPVTGNYSPSNRVHEPPFPRSAGTPMPRNHPRAFKSHSRPASPPSTGTTEDFLRGYPGASDRPGHQPMNNFRGSFNHDQSRPQVLDPFTGIPSSNVRYPEWYDNRRARTSDSQMWW